MCICTNGVASTGANCPENGASKCVSCSTGWRINNDRTECTSKSAHCHVHKNISKHKALHPFVLCVAENICTCENGVAPTGSGCPVNSAAKCTSCNTGWTINNQKTKCIGTYAHCFMLMDKTYSESSPRLRLRRKCLHLQERCGTDGCGVPCARRHEVQVVLHRVDTKPTYEEVYLYVQNVHAAYRNTFVF